MTGQETMVSLPFALLSVAVGLTMVFANAAVTAWIVRDQNRAFGRRFGRQHVRSGRILVFVVGVVFLVLGGQVIVQWLIRA